MPRRALTEITVRNLQPLAAGQLTVWDSLPGFGVRVSPGGAKSFIVLLGSGRRRTIGRYPIICLADARAEAKRLLAELTLGKHRTTSITFSNALTLFLETHYQGKKPRSKADTERLLKRHFLPKLRHDRLENITTQTIAAIIDKLQHVPSEQRHTLTAIGTFFRWGVRRRYLSHNPSEGLTLSRRPARSRVLEDHELAAVWRAADEDTAFHKIVRFCILLGQRRSEIGLLRAEYISWEDNTITLPPEIVKNNRVHTFPFGEMACQILKSLATNGYLFPGRYNDDRPFNGWAKSKRELDQKIMEAGRSVAPYTLHDLRRTFATNLAALSVPPHITERLLNHATGTISGVAAIYNRHAYMDEMREAVSKWEARLSSLLKS